MTYAVVGFLALILNLIIVSEIFERADRQMYEDKQSLKEIEKAKQ